MSWFGWLVSHLVCIAFGALLNDCGVWPSAEKRDRTIRFFSEEHRLRRYRERLCRRLKKIETLEERAARNVSVRERITTLEGELADKAFSKPEEFINSK